MVTLDIYIGDPYVKQYMRREKITIISFIGNVGGLLGLFMGFSFVSIVEFFYIFCFGSTRSDSGERWATPPNSGKTVPTRKGRNFLPFLGDSSYARKNAVTDGYDVRE